QLSMQVMGLRGVVEKTLADYRERAAGKEVRLVNQVPELEVWADPGRLEQALGNLVDNAIKYGKTGGTVTVGAEPARETHLQVEVWVADDGPGIPAESLDRVFERFYRVDKARSRDQGGTGLGLSIVKHIIQSHGGRVWATSEPDQGAVFRFTLPARQQRADSV
ncbi:MAG TPA: HAMP domain-containing sensor histidine kinase, partial [Clostridia bacterium]|nr:HAMP domain-containing sensor histidine kinase [Clostridia bacterium]